MIIIFFYLTKQLIVYMDNYNIIMNGYKSPLDSETCVDIKIDFVNLTTKKIFISLELKGLKTIYGTNDNVDYENDLPMKSLKQLRDDLYKDKTISVTLDGLNGGFILSKTNDILSITLIKNIGEFSSKLRFNLIINKNIEELISFLMRVRPNNVNKYYINETYEMS